MKALKVSCALILLLLAGLLAAIEVVALVDPVGTKMADDGDPFGPPHIVTWQELVFVSLVIISLVLIAFRLLGQALGKRGE